MREAPAGVLPCCPHPRRGTSSSLYPHKPSGQCQRSLHMAAKCNQRCLIEALTRCTYIYCPEKTTPPISTDHLPTRCHCNTWTSARRYGLSPSPYTPLRRLPINFIYNINKKNVSWLLRNLRGRGACRQGMPLGLHTPAYSKKV